MRANTEAVFWSRIDESDDCWQWLGTIKNEPPRNYGQMHYRGRSWMAHRLAWTFRFGPIPEGLQVLHTCDNPECVNPDHLWLGTQADNMRDRDEKGRMFKRLEGTDVKSIRVLYETGTFTQYMLAEMFDVTRGTIGDVVNGRTWRNLEAK